MSYLDAVIASIPGKSGILIRRFYYSVLAGKVLSISVASNVSIKGIENINFGRGVTIGSGSFLSARSGGSITVGDFVAFNSSCHVNADFSGSILIGRESIFGPYAILRASNHSYGYKVSPRFSAHSRNNLYWKFRMVWCSMHISRQMFCS